MSIAGIKLIVLERDEQIRKHKYNAVHDMGHNKDELALAAAHAIMIGCGWEGTTLCPDDWEEFKEKIAKKSRIEQLSVAGALIAAEIDRLLNVAKLRIVVAMEKREWTYDPAQELFTRPDDGIEKISMDAMFALLVEGDSPEEIEALADRIQAGSAWAKRNLK